LNRLATWESRTCSRRVTISAKRTRFTPRRSGVKSVAPGGTGTLVARVARGFANAGVEFNREAVAKLIRKELQELRRMPYLSDIGRETADKAERLFTFINSRFSA
jgi:hypothetical protein